MNNLLDHECPRCGYIVYHKGDMRKHLQKKRLCKPNKADISLDSFREEYFKEKESSYNCDFCDKSFLSRSGWYKHQKTCDKIKERLEIQELKNQIKTLVQKNKEIEERIEHSTSNNITNNINNISNINNINNNININISLRPFGSEITTYLNDEIIGDLFFMGLNFRELLKYLHFDPEYPENHNIRIKSVKRSLLEIYRGNKWDIVTFMNGLTEMVKNSNKLFQEYYNNNEDEVRNGMTIEEREQILKQMYSENILQDIAKSIEKDIIVMLENQRNTGLIDTLEPSQIRSDSPPPISPSSSLTS